MPAEHSNEHENLNTSSRHLCLLSHRNIRTRYARGMKHGHFPVSHSLPLSLSFYLSHSILLTQTQTNIKSCLVGWCFECALGLKTRHTHVYPGYIPTGFSIKKIVYLYRGYMNAERSEKKTRGKKVCSTKATNRMVLFEFLFAQCSHIRIAKITRSHRIRNTHKQYFLCIIPSLNLHFRSATLIYKNNNKRNSDKLAREW